MAKKMTAKERRGLSEMNRQLSRYVFGIAPRRANKRRDFMERRRAIRRQRVFGHK